MKKKTKGKTTSTKKKPTQFSIDLDTKGLGFFLLLVLLTAGTVFYLGMIFGKATRDPNEPLVLSPSETQKTETQTRQNEPVPADSLEIYNIRDDSAELTDLKSNTDQVLKTADRMIKEAEPVQTSPRVAKKPVVTEKQPSVSVPKDPPQKQWPDSPATSETGDIYTVQILATKDKGKAERYVRQLRKKAFDAYIVETTVEQTKVYRIRVGKQDKEEIEKLKQRLEKVTVGMGNPKVIKIN